MMQVNIDISERTNKILNIIKVKHNLKDKSDAINLLAEHYEADFLEPEVRPEYIKKLKRIMKGKFRSFKDIDELRKIIEK